MKNTKKVNWLIPIGLILLTLIPSVAGTIRLSQLATGAEVTPENARFFASPIPVVLHIVSVFLYSILGAFQVAPGFRQRWSRWHRTIGRLLIPCGLIAALTGLWMTQFYPWPEGDGVILYVTRLVVGTAMLLSILIGINAIRQRDYKAHGDWMLRAYALGMGAGTQAMILLPWSIVVGPTNEFSKAMLMGAAWLINLAVAEWVIRRKPAKQNKTRLTARMMHV